MLLRHLAFGFVLFASPALAQTASSPAESPPVCGPPSPIEDGWRIAPPESVGLEPAALCALKERFTQFSRANVHSIVVTRRGTLVFEQYFGGDDEREGRPAGRFEFGPQTRHDLRSVTKSVVSLLVGAAIDRKLIASIDEPVLKFFPEYADLRSPDKDRILLRHLLSMSSGLEWDELRPYTDPLNSEIRMINAPDRYRYVLENGS